MTTPADTNQPRLTPFAMLESSPPLMKQATVRSVNTTHTPFALLGNEELAKEAFIKDFVDGAWNKAIKPIGRGIGKAVSGVGDTIGGAVKAGWNGLTAIPGAVLGAASGAWDRKGEGLGGFLQGGFDGAYNSLATDTNDWLNGIKQMGGGVGNIGGGAWDVVKNFNPVMLPYNAMSGGVQGVMDGMGGDAPTPAAPAAAPAPASPAAPAQPKKPLFDQLANPGAAAGAAAGTVAGGAATNAANPTQAGGSSGGIFGTLGAAGRNVAQAAQNAAKTVTAPTPAPTPAPTTPGVVPAAPATPPPLPAAGARPPVPTITDQHRAAFQRGTRSTYDPNSWLDRNKMDALLRGQRNWANNANARNVGRGQRYDWMSKSGGENITPFAALEKEAMLKGVGNILRWGGGKLRRSGAKARQSGKTRGGGGDDVIELGGPTGRAPGPNATTSEMILHPTANRVPTAARMAGEGRLGLGNKLKGMGNSLDDWAAANPGLARAINIGVPTGAAGIGMYGANRMGHSSGRELGIGEGYDVGSQIGAQLALQAQPKDPGILGRILDVFTGQEKGPDYATIQGLLDSHRSQILPAILKGSY